MAVHMEDSIVVGAPIEQVFAFVADFRNTPKWHRNMKQAGFRSSGPPGTGSEYDWVERFAWKTLDLGGVITSWSPPSGFTWRPHGGPFPMTGGWTFEAIEGGTKVVRFSDTELTGVMKRAPGIMTAIARRQVRQELKALKRVIESSAPTPA